jgi:DNA-3-methyladenine glycosylase
LTLPRGFYERDSREVAVDLIGRTLTHDSPEGRASGVIVETEAYRPDDPACHAYRGPTMRNRNLFGPPGTAYVYLSYGVHALLNLVCEEEGVGSAVLVRALRPLEGIELMQRRRGRSNHLADGPGRLTQALGVPLEYDGASLLDGGPLTVSREVPETGEVVATTRIGISRGAELPWRYLLEGDPDVSVRPREILARGLERSWPDRSGKACCRADGPAPRSRTPR